MTEVEIIECERDGCFEEFELEEDGSARCPACGKKHVDKDEEEEEEEVEEETAEGEEDDESPSHPAVENPFPPGFADWPKGDQVAWLETSFKRVGVLRRVLLEAEVQTDREFDDHTALTKGELAQIYLALVT